MKIRLRIQPLKIVTTALQYQVFRAKHKQLQTHGAFGTQHVYQNTKNSITGKTEIKGRFEKVNPISEKLQAKLRRKGLDELTLETLIGGEAA